jgi:hypothetical protein
MLRRWSREGVVTGPTITDFYPYGVRARKDIELDDVRCRVLHRVRHKLAHEQRDRALDPG